MSDPNERNAEELFSGFNAIQPNADTSSQAIERTRRALRARSVQSVAAGQPLKKIRMSRNMFAAAVVLALIVASVALPTLFSPSSATGFAQVREQLSGVRTMTFDVKLNYPSSISASLLC